MPSKRLRASCVLIQISLILTLAAHCARAQETDEEPDPVMQKMVLLKLDKRVTQFLDYGVHGDEQAKAFDDLLVGSPLSKTSDSYKTLLSQTKEIEKRFGKFQESERIGAKQVGKDLVLLKYLFKCENYPVVWYFTYYRDFGHRAAATEDENWVIISVRFDTNLAALE